MEEEDVKMNIEDRRKVRSIQRKVARQNARILNKYQDRLQTLRDMSKVDWSLFNLILDRVDFTECKNSLDTLHKFYTASWGYLAKIIRENYNMRAILAKYCFDDMGNLTMDVSESDRQVIEEICQGEGDPLEVSRAALEEIRKAAKKRARAARQGLITPTKPKIIT